MTQWEWDLKVFDVSAGKWISGIEQDDITGLSVTRGITDVIGEFQFDFDVESTNIDAEDVVVINIGHRGSSVLKWMTGKVNKSIEKGDSWDRYYTVQGMEITRVLLDIDAPDIDYDQEQAQTIILEVVSSISFDFNSAREWVSNEPIFISQYDQWLDLSAPELVSGSWTLYYNGSSRRHGNTSGSDYYMDLSTNPPTGRIKVWSSNAAIKRGYAYAEYQTDRPLVMGRLMGGVRRTEITTSSVFNETDTLNANMAGAHMFAAVQGVVAHTPLVYDFWLDPDLELHTQGRNSGTLYTYDYDEVDELEVYRDSSWLLNETIVKNAGGGAEVYWPNVDEYTEFEGDPLSSFWIAGGASQGVFDCNIRFSDTSSDASTYGGRFRDTYDLTPTLSSVATGTRVGSNHLRAEVSDTNLRALQVWRTFVPPTSSLGDVTLRNSMHIFEFGTPAYDDVLFRVDAYTTDDDKYYKTMILTSGTSFSDTDTVLTGGWGNVGDPSWTSISKIAFTVYEGDPSATSMTLDLDGWYFGSAPLIAWASDGASQSAYGIIKTNGLVPYPVIDNTITSYLEAQERANAIIAQYKDPIQIIERVHFDDGNLDLSPGDKLQIETRVDGVYYTTTRIASITHNIDGSDVETTVECRASTPVGIESYMEELELEIRRLEMREQ